LVLEFLICLILMIYYMVCTRILLHSIQCLIFVSICQYSSVMVLLGMFPSMLLEWCWYVSLLIYFLFLNIDLVHLPIKLECGVIAFPSHLGSCFIILLIYWVYLLQFISYISLVCNIVVLTSACWVFATLANHVMFWS